MSTPNAIPIFLIWWDGVVVAGLVVAGLAPRPSPASLGLAICYHLPAISSYHQGGKRLEIRDSKYNKDR